MVQPEKQRSTLGIYIDILESVRELGNAKPTHILYKANLSHDRLTKYLDELVGKGLIAVKLDGDSRYYVMTPSGVQFLIEIRKAEAFVSGFGIAL
ncbi:MAG: winged helix-turn-helix domain-containing protein [Thaumarchaeota archaeon]|nr:winged helix-turn-helix domain-containing protein [Nitrososphaerota archaeon]